MEESTKLLVNKCIDRDMARTHLIMERIEEGENLSLRLHPGTLAPNAMPLREIQEREVFKLIVMEIMSEYSLIGYGW